MRGFAAAMRSMENEVPYIERVQIREHLIDLWHAHLTDEQKAETTMAYLAECARVVMEQVLSVDVLLTMTAEELLKWHPSAR